MSVKPMFQLLTDASDQKVVSTTTRIPGTVVKTSQSFTTSPL